MNPTTTEILVRDATAADAELIAKYNDDLAHESEGRPLDMPTVRAGVARVLADPTLGRYFIAELAGRAVGQTMLTYEWSDWRNAMFWWIQSVYVDPQFRRRGVFTALCRHVEQLARASEGVTGLRLYVEGNNTAAQHTYARLGFANSGHAVKEIDWSGLPPVSEGHR